MNHFLIPGILIGALLLAGWVEKWEREKAARKKREVELKLMLGKAQRIQKQAKAIADVLRVLAE